MANITTAADEGRGRMSDKVDECAVLEKCCRRADRNVCPAVKRSGECKGLRPSLGIGNPWDCLRIVRAAVGGLGAYNSRRPGKDKALWGIGLSIAPGWADNGATPALILR
jgi:hypothetical protein